MKTQPSDQPARDQAVDPERSCIVQAPAGAGKTTLLATRYLNLLARADRPEDILAITFTKKAAQEMRHRVLGLLAAGDASALQARQRDKQMGWALQQNPNRLKIQTIDSFAFDLASRLTEADSLHGWTIIENGEDLYNQAIDRLIRQLHRGADSAPLIADMIAFLENDVDTLRRLFVSMLGRRDQWLPVVASVASAGRVNPGLLNDLLLDTLTAIHDEAMAEFHALLTPSERTYVNETVTALGTRPAQLYKQLITTTGSLRKKVNRNQGFTQTDQRAAFNAFLDALRTRGAAAGLERLARLPLPDALQIDGEHLNLCCINLALAVAELERVCADLNRIDFTGLLIMAKRALRDQEDNPTDLALLLDYRIKHVLIDEFQDTSRSQFGFFELLLESWDASAGQTFFAVGDPMQSIYGFRDADVEVFREVLERGIQQLKPAPLKLTSNFRSAESLVRWVNETFTSMGDSDSLLAPATGTRPDRPGDGAQCLGYVDEQQELNAVIAHVEHLVARHPGESIGVLCRARTHVQQLVEALQNRNLPFSGTDMSALKDRAIVRDLLSVTQLLLQSDEKLAWYALLRSPIFGVPLTDLPDAYAALCAEDEQPRLSTYRLRAFRRALTWAQRAMHEISLRETVEGFWQRCGAPWAYPENERRHADVYFRLLSEFDGGPARFSEIERRVQTLFATGNSDAQINLLTVHKSKGLEFDHVIVPSLEKATANSESDLLLWSLTAHGLIMGVRKDDIHEWLKSVNREKENAEATRLLYVACTRARYSLFLSCTHAEMKPRGLAALLSEHIDWQEPADTRPSQAGQFQMEMFSTPSMQRLPGQFETPPLPASELPTTPHAPPVDPIEHRAEVALGILIHRLLAHLGNQGDVSDDKATRLLQIWLEPGMPDDQRQIFIQQALQHVRALQRTQAGAWALQSHPEHECETAFDAVIDGEALTVVLDRTFVEDGTRWVVDYKTGKADADQPELAVERYRAQMTTYHRVASAFFGAPVRTALLLTHTGQLVEVHSKSREQE